MGLQMAWEPLRDESTSISAHDSPAGQIWNQYQMQLQRTGDFMKGTPLELKTPSVHQYRDSKRLNKVNCPFLDIQQPKSD